MATRSEPLSRLTGRFRFVTDCRGSTYEDISAMIEQEEPISLATFRKAIGPDEWKAIQSDLGYGRDFSIYGDWHIQYCRSVYRRVPCVFLRWSRIEFVFTLDGKQGPSAARRR